MEVLHASGELIIQDLRVEVDRAWNFRAWAEPSLQIPSPSRAEPKNFEPESSLNLGIKQNHNFLKGKREKNANVRNFLLKMCIF